MHTYAELCNTTGRLTSYYNDAKRMEELKMEFYGMYFGEVDIFDDTEVKNASYEFKTVLEKFSAENSSSIEQQYLNQLRSASDSLARACKNSLESK